jgi:hypothetical protein
MTHCLWESTCIAQRPLAVLFFPGATKYLDLIACTTATEERFMMHCLWESTCIAQCPLGVLFFPGGTKYLDLIACTTATEEHFMMHCLSFFPEITR